MAATPTPGRRFRSRTPPAVEPMLRLQIVAQRQAILEQRLSGVEHARTVATGDEVRTLEPLLRGDD